MFRASFLLSLFLVSGIALPIRAAEPAVRNLDIRGLKIAGTTTITIDGDDLSKAPRLLLPFAAKTTLKPGSSDKKAIFDVTLGPAVEPGYHHLRLVTEGGVSLPTVIAIDRMTQQLATAPIKELPVAIHGTVAGPAVVEAKFQGKANQKVMIEVEAQRLGSKLRPVAHLYNARKLQVAWIWGTPSLFGDARLATVLPEDGVYTVTLHDAEYAAAAPSFYRLKIGQWDFVDQVFPPVIAKDQAWTIGLQGSQSAQMTLKAKPNAAVMPLPWPTKGAGAWSGPRPFVMVSSHAEFVEQPKSDRMQEIPSGLVGISGRLETPYEEDQYRVAVTPGKKVRLDVFAERIGSTLDCALVVRNDKGAQLARAEDSPGTLDPILEYAVPDKVTSIIVGVIDAQGRGGPRGVYRLVIDPLTAGSTKDGFKLTTPAQRISVADGGRTIVPIQVDRKGGYQGKIDIIPARELPGVKLTGASIPEGGDGALVTIERTGPTFEPIIAEWHGRTPDGIEHSVTIKGHPLERLQPWLASEFALAPSSDKGNEFAVEWRDLKETAGLIPAEKLLLPVKLTRPMGKQTVKLTLMTSQNTPIVNNQPDPNKAIRQDKLADLAATVNTGDVTALVPPDLSAPVYDVTVQADLLDPAKKVIATAHAPVRRMQVIMPIALKLDGPPRIEAPFDVKKGAVVKLQGKLERREGVKADVALALTGLPLGAKAEAVTLKGDATAFTLNVTFPPNVSVGEINGVKLSGSYAPNAKLPNVRVKSREVELTLVLKAAPK
jgi:hypothetical protein